MQINKQVNDLFGLGYCTYLKLNDSKKQETIEFIFTKGKLELIVEEVERINVYNESLNIIKKNGTTTFVNLNTVTTMT